MAKLRNATTLGTAGVIVLALLAIAMSAASLLQHRGGVAEPAPAGTPTTDAFPGATAPRSESAPPTEPVVSPDVTPAESENPTTPAESALTVVVIGDTYSVRQESPIWLDEVATVLDWEEVVNLSTVGRGYLASPSECELEVCANFEGSIALITEHDPDIVITFGGTADGDTPLEDPTATYFQALREALPDAQLVAISPITTDASPPYYLGMHASAISAAVTSVDGTFIDVGQPSAGDGETVSEAAHVEIAELVVDEMSEQQ